MPPKTSAWVCFLTIKDTFEGLVMAGGPTGPGDICILVETLRLAGHRVGWVTYLLKEFSLPFFYIDNRSG